MKSVGPDSKHTLFKTLAVAGASFTGIAGMMIGSVTGSLAAIPASAAALGYGMGGWVSGLAGFVLGTVANFIPVHREAEEILPGDDQPEHRQHRPGSEEETEKEYVYLSDYAGKICGLAGGLIGAFTGAAVGAAVGVFVQLSENRQAHMNGTARRKDRDNDHFPH